MIKFKFLMGPETAEPESQIPLEQRIPWPLDSLVMYVYEDGRLVGRMGLMSIKIMEGTWAVEDKRGSRLLFQMLRQFEEMVKTLGTTSLVTQAADSQPEIEGYLKRLDFERLPTTLMIKDLNKKEEAA